MIVSPGVQPSKVVLYVDGDDSKTRGVGFVMSQDTSTLIYCIQAYLLHCCTPYRQQIVDCQGGRWKKSSYRALQDLHRGSY
jgi:hypothetical protein